MPAALATLAMPGLSEVAQGNEQKRGARLHLPMPVEVSPKIRVLRSRRMMVSSCEMLVCVYEVPVLSL